MTLSVQGFREAFPQFTEELFPSARVGFYLTFAEKQLSFERWDTLWVEGCYLHTAHNLTLEQVALKNTDGTGGVDATAGTVVSVSKAVGGVSYSETKAGSASTANPMAGEWNLTWYGQKYWQLCQLLGVGGLVV